MSDDPVCLSCSSSRPHGPHGCSLFDIKVVLLYFERKESLWSTADNTKVLVRQSGQLNSSQWWFVGATTRGEQEKQ